MTTYHRAFLAICMTLTAWRAFGADAGNEVVVLPKFVVEADRFVFSMSWHCKWPTQKSKITRAWFTEVPKGGIVERAGIQTNDRLLQYDEAVLSEMTGDWLADRLKRPWRPGEIHELLIERDGKRFKITIEMKKKPKQSSEPMGSTSSPQATESRIARLAPSRAGTSAIAALSGDKHL